MKDDALDINLLERRVDELIRTVDRLREENTALQYERNRLLEKTEQARGRVEAMILRIRAMEQG